MAGRGPAPKDPSTRVRRNKAPEVRELRPIGHIVKQPPLPDDVEWPEATRRWWATWRDAPQSDDFGPTDWDFLLDTALIHREIWLEKNLTRMPELRLRVAKFGATPEDRARLKIAYADAFVAQDIATERHERRQRRQHDGQDPRRALHVV